ncbi:MULTISPECIES: hypothetical protein [unclassified Gordonia (in: high G+C Gram-positive bacteria)]
MAGETVPDGVTGTDGVTVPDGVTGTAGLNVGVTGTAGVIVGVTGTAGVTVGVTGTAGLIVGLTGTAGVTVPDGVTGTAGDTVLVDAELVDAGAVTDDVGVAAAWPCPTIVTPNSAAPATATPAMPTSIALRRRRESGAVVGVSPEVGPGF